MSMFPWRFNNFISTAICGALLFGVAPQSSAAAFSGAAGGYFTIYAGLRGASGDSGGDSDNIFSLARSGVGPRGIERTRFEVPVPYLYLDTVSALHGSGKTYLHSQNAGTQTTGRLQPGGGNSSITGGGAYAFDRGDPGNQNLSAAFSLLPEENLLPRLRATAQLQYFPLDRYSGPVSGEIHAGLGLILDKWLGKWNLFSEASYIFLGGSELYNPNGYLSYSTGIGYQLFDSLNMALFGNGAVLASDGSQDLMEGGFRISWMFLKKAGLECYASRGFNEWSPDYGAGLALLSYF